MVNDKLSHVDVTKMRIREMKTYMCIITILAALGLSGCSSLPTDKLISGVVGMIDIRSEYGKARTEWDDLYEQWRSVDVAVLPEGDTVMLNRSIGDIQSAWDAMDRWHREGITSDAIWFGVTYNAAKNGSINLELLYIKHQGLLSEVDRINIGSMIRQLKVLFKKVDEMVSKDDRIETMVRILSTFTTTLEPWVTKTIREKA